MRALIAELPASRIPALARGGPRLAAPAPSSETRQLYQRSIHAARAELFYLISAAAVCSPAACWECSFCPVSQFG